VANQIKVIHPRVSLIDEHYVPIQETRASLI